MIHRFLIRGILACRKIPALPRFHVVPTSTLYQQNKLYFTSSSDMSQIALLEEVQAKIYQVLKTAAKCNQAKLSKTATFEQLGFDSLDSVELVVAMQQYFGIDIPNEEAEKITSVQIAINTFFRYMNAKIANKMVESNQQTKIEQKK